MKLPKLNTKFLGDFLKGMSNEPGGHSLRKWLAVGCFWIMGVIAIRYTDKDNLFAVLGIFASLITALIITYTAGNIKERKIDSNIDKPKEDGKPTE